MTWLVLAGAALGLLCGSFANVLIARVPAGERWAHDRSRCPRCGHQLAWHDNIPVLSWLWLRRRCGYCAEPISARYPAVELVTSALFAVTVLVHGATWSTVGLLYLALISVALVVIDLDVQRLPNSLVLPAIPVVAVAVAAEAGSQGDWWILARAGLAALALGGFYFAMWFAYPKGLGFGDVKTAVLLGLALGAIGWDALAVGAFLGPMLGGAAGIAAIVRHRKVSDVRLAYGPWLIGGAWIGILAGPQLWDAYIDLTLGA
ncbi:prepilin peptidase [Demequina mangrovi]|uniref:Leader peptidase (Prepilin peptidase) / N-methyltransferase n=1 Tax=Demequina mangrovi TaxID=1043493 RepID=A0A1H6U255_9MICO|nr:A24 family peptidase [Demequina mangrovi]SEI86409.1 leader peptidase (prepilin peptidase) / N-methyltransferase [Demequina mangrovi]